jgi:hypothetical protein
MLQVVNGILVYVVEFDKLPELPVRGTGVEEFYADALTSAIERGTITQPGKYAIQINIKNSELYYDVYQIFE